MSKPSLHEWEDPTADAVLAEIEPEDRLDLAVEERKVEQVAKMFLPGNTWLSWVTQRRAMMAGRTTEDPKVMANALRAAADTQDRAYGKAVQPIAHEGAVTGVIILPAVRALPEEGRDG